MSETHIDAETGYTLNTFTNVRDTLSGVWYRLWGAVPAYTNIVRMIWSICRALHAVGGGRVYRDSTDSATQFSITALSYIYRGVVKSLSASVNNAMSGGNGVYSIYAIPSSTAVQVSAVGGGWPTGPHVRIAQITVASSAWSQITGVTDYRNTCDLRVIGEGPAGVNAVEPLTTGTRAITTADRYTRFTNVGAAGSVEFDLPAATLGDSFSFAVCAAQNLVVKASGSETIRIEGTASTAGGTATSNTIGDCLTLECVEAGKWAATAVTHAAGWTLSS